MKKIKKLLDCIYFYPVTVVLVFLALFIVFDRYLSIQSGKLVAKGVKKDLLQSSYMIKALVEDYSFSKNSAFIDKKIKQIASKDKSLRLIALSNKDVVLYATDPLIVGTKLKNNRLYSHNKQQVYKQNRYTYEVILNVRRLYNPVTKRVQRGYLLLIQNIKNKLQSANSGEITTLRWLFVIATLSVLALFYLFNTIFVKKIKKIEEISEELSDDKQKTEPTNLNSIINRLQSTILKLNLLSKVVEYSNDSVIITDSNRHIISVNKSFEHITGYKSKEAIGKDPSEVFASGMTSDKFYQKMYASIEKTGRFEGEILNRHKDGSSYLAWINVWALQDSKTKQVTNYVGISKDLSEILKKQKEIERLAYFDTLTGLANRDYFLKLLDEIVVFKAQKHEAFALLSIDIDAFKEINDTLGHKVGDKMLQDFAAHLKGVCGSGDIVARIGGDEFALLLMNVKGPTDALEKACDILQMKQTSTKKMHVSVGIAMFPVDGAGSDALLAASNIAMHHSKQNTQIKCTLFQEEMQKEARQKIALKEELDRAIRHNELRLFYQPKFSVKGKRLVGFEALIRWEHPTKGFVYPDIFIPLAEESGLIIAMTAWIFKEVNVTCSKFNEIYPYFGSIAINISAKHFKTMGLVQEIESLIDDRCIKAGHISIEITESAVMNQLDETNMQLLRLRDKGIKIALDDYGTGYSSLAYLKNLPIDIIKIDKSFVDGLCCNQEDFAIVKSTIDLAKSLGLETVIEGVEDNEQLKILKQLNADTIQGYIYSKPLSLKDTMTLLTNLATGV